MHIAQLSKPLEGSEAPAAAAAESEQQDVGARASDEAAAAVVEDEYVKEKYASAASLVPAPALAIVAGCARGRAQRVGRMTRG